MTEQSGTRSRHQLMTSARNRGFLAPMRLPHRVKRRRAMIAGTAAVLTLALGTFLLNGNLQERSGRAAQDLAHREHPPLPAGSERLVPGLSFTVTQKATNQTRTPKVPFFEVFPDGSVARVPVTVPQNTTLELFRPLPDGRVIVGAVPNAPTGHGFILRVLDKQGGIQSDNDVQIKGEQVSMLNTTGAAAVLQRFTADSQRPARIVARDLSTGKERTLGENSQTASHGDVAGDRLVLAGGGLDESAKAPDHEPQCWITSFATGAGAGKQSSVPSCHLITEVNISPNGRFAAVVYERWVDPAELRLRIIDLKNIRMLSDELLGNPLSCRTDCATTNGGYLGMAWNSGASLRVALLDPLPLGLKPDKVLPAIEDRLRTQIRTMIA